MVVWTWSSVQICSAMAGSCVERYCSKSCSTLRWSCSNMLMGSGMPPPCLSESFGCVLEASYPGSAGVHVVEGGGGCLDVAAVAALGVGGDGDLVGAGRGVPVGRR